MMTESGQTSPLILVVDDEPLLRLDICGALEEEGYRTAEASNGAEALLQIEQHAPALIVTDMHMPDIDGIALIRGLRHAGVSTPIVGMSGDLNTLGGLTTALNVGANAALAKPFAMSEIVRVVNEFAKPRES